jgi:AcrR family transcriptional regulator
MVKALDGTRNKHQARTQETQRRVLDAAQTLFSDQGFEKTQLEEVAARAGYTRGAIYAHYESKEDLFLALMEQRVLTKFNSIRQVIEAEPMMSKRPGIFRDWIAAQAADHTWGTLMLEFKLYALRRPESREKLLRTYEMIAGASGKDFIESLFGANLEKSARTSVERRLVILGAILSAVNLECLFRPKLMPKQHVQPVLDELFRVLIRV